MIKPLGRQLLLPNPEPDLYLCVDETTTRKKFLAQMLEENTQGKYDLEWCVKALEQENEDLNQSQTWLGRNAPSKRKNPIVKA
jgi:hypothetical protein